MIGNLSMTQRSWNMSQIRSKDTKPERIVRSLLHSLGFRFRLHSKELPGKPDLTLKKYKTVIFVNGCFWHHHKNCKRATFPKTNKDYWIPKIKRNLQRDRDNEHQLKKMGWKVITIWECQVMKIDELTHIINKVLR